MLSVFYHCFVVVVRAVRIPLSFAHANVGYDFFEFFCCRHKAFFSASGGSGECCWLANVHTASTMATLAETKEIFRSADAVCFDVDSTVIKEEGIDELAKFCGVGDAVTEMTRKAMGGSMTFKTALTERLAIIRCSREQVNKLITDHPPQLTPGVKELVKSLQQRGVKVFLVSGGFRCIVEHVASQLGIPLDHVYANRLKFYFNGEYAGFDETQPTAESGGKGRVISLLKELYGLEKVVMIGDGATDLEACPPASAFIGFGGNVVRPQVKERSSWYVTSFGELLKELEKI